MKEKNKISDRVRLQLILDAITDIKSFVGSISEENFLSNRLIQNACAKSLQDLCNAAEDLSDSIKTDNPHLPWVQMEGIRNRLAHEYFGINYKIIWQVFKMNYLKSNIAFKNFWRIFKTAKSNLPA